MDELKMIEDELVPVYETSTGEKVVYGTELHEKLGVRTPYKDWSERRLSDCEAVEGEDYEAAQICAPSGQARKEHIVRLDLAKEMAMLERNERGKQVRRYFIQVEKKYKQNILEGLSPELRAILVHDKQLQQISGEVKAVKQDLQDFKGDMPLLGIDCDVIRSEKNKRVVPLLGGKDAPAYKDKSLRGKVYRDLETQIYRQFGVETYKAIKRSQCGQAVQIIRDYELPLILRQEIDTINTAS